MKTTIKILITLLLIIQTVVLSACNNFSVPSDNGQIDLPNDSEVVELPNEIKNIILIIGDGMGLEHITAGQLASGEEFSFVNSDDWQFAVVNTDSIKQSGRDTVTTDSAASGTALATGTLTVNKYVGKDRLGRDLTTVLDYAKSLGKSTGIVTTDTLHAATPAAFSAHSLNRDNTDEIILSQIDSGVDLLCGDANEASAKRLSQITEKGYAYCDNFSKIDSTMDAEKAYWQFYLGGHYSKAKGATVKLKNATVKALDFLDRNEEGFVLMIEQAHPDLFSHVNDLDGAIWGVNSLNDTVNAVIEWLGDRTDTAIIVTSDHETGGLSVTLNPIFEDHLPIKNKNGTVTNIYYKYLSTGHTDAKVGIFIYGIKADLANFSYYKNALVIKNTDLNALMKDILNRPEAYAISE